MKIKVYTVKVLLISIGLLPGLLGAKSYINSIKTKEGSISHLIEIESTDTPLWTQWGQESMLSSVTLQKKFFIQQVALRGSLQKQLAAINKVYQGILYVELQEVKKPVVGVVLTITYNKETTGVDLHTFSPLDVQKGLVIVIVDKNKMKKLLTTTTTPLHYAVNHKGRKERLAFNKLCWV